MSELVFNFLVGVSVGLVAGKFLCVFTLQLPMWIERDCRITASEFLGFPFAAPPAVSLVKASNSKSIRSIAILILCSGAGFLVLERFGVSVAALVYGILIWSLIGLAVMDHESMILPDVIVIPLVWGGLLYFALSAPAVLPSHVIASVLGYGALRFLPGVGEGDAKLAAAAGAWIGLEGWPHFMLISSFFGVVVGAAYYAVRRQSKLYPFGPSLVAGMVLLIVFPGIALLRFDSIPFTSWYQAFAMPG